jgi:ubiquinone/menaquinone biosynthesis C-methylase UbiE
VAVRYSLLICSVLLWVGASTFAQNSRLYSPRNIDALENENRDDWQKPVQVVEALGIVSGATIADIGTGSGYFVPYLSKATGPEGHLFAVDIQQEMLAFVERKVGERGLVNVTTVLSQENDTRLEPGSVDLALLVDVYHELRSPKALLSNIKNVLKPQGRLAIIDFYSDKEVPVGPTRRYRVPRERLVSEAKAVGYKLTEEHAFLPYQYFLVFEVRSSTDAKREDP